MHILNVASPNYQVGRKSYKPEAIVIHIMQGTLYGTDCWFQSPQSKTSAHYGVGKWGEVHQYVKEQDTAFHCSKADAPTWNLVKYAPNGLFINPDYYTIGIEHEGDVNTEWTDEMYVASSRLIASLSLRWDIPLDRDHVIGHTEIYSLKKCPGNKADMDRLIAMANEMVQKRNATKCENPACNLVLSK